jgi:hypothetical protein
VLLAGGIKMILHQPLALTKMIAPSVGNCKCFDKLDQSEIYFSRGCPLW